MSNLGITTVHELTVEIYGKKHKLSLADAQRLYDLLGNQAGVRRHGVTVGDVWRRPYTYPYPTWNTNVIGASKSSGSGIKVTASGD